jgi:hypothetical protein
MNVPAAMAGVPAATARRASAACPARTTTTSAMATGADPKALRGALRRIEEPLDE